MKLRELLQQLEQGELRQMALGGSDASGVLERDYFKVLPHINLGLAAIHKKFQIKTKTVMVQQYDQISTYILDQRYAETNTESSEPIKYIKDSVFDPFTDGSKVLKIEAVYDELGRKYHLNNPNEPASLFTPSIRSIQVPYPDSANAMSVMYRAGHPTLLDKMPDGSDPLDQEVEITDTYLEPLVLFIGSRYLKTQGNEQSSIAGANMGAEYRNSVREVKNDGLDVVDDTTNYKLDDNGFV